MVYYWCKSGPQYLSLSKQEHSTHFYAVLRYCTRRDGEISTALRNRLQISTCSRVESLSGGHSNKIRPSLNVVTELRSSKNNSN